MKLGLPRVIKTRKPHTASVPQIISEAQMSGPSWRTFKQFNKGTQPFKTRREAAFPDSIPVDFLVSPSPLDPQPYVLH